MDYVSLGQTGLKVSSLCFGTWRFGRQNGGIVETDRDEAHELLDEAWELGFNYFDTANGYGDPGGTSETIIGEWLEDHDREDVVISSKVGHEFDGRGEPGPNDSGLGRKHIRSQIDGTLERLGTSYIDIYHIHQWDNNTPIVETLRTLNDLVREGSVHHLGISTVAAWKLVETLRTGESEGLEPIRVALPPFDATYSKMRKYGDFNLDPYLEVCEKYGLAVCPHSPLGGGFLTGKYVRGGEMPENSRGALIPDRFERYYVSDVAWNVLDEVTAVAEEVDATPAQVALAWLLHQDRFSAVVPIVGARTSDQLTENVGSCDVSLSRSQVDRIHQARTEIRE